MKTKLIHFSALIAAGLSLIPLMTPDPAQAQNSGSVTGGSVTDGSVSGGNVRGGDVKGGDVTGGNVTGGSVTGGSVTGGSTTGGTVTPGTVTPGTVTPGTATPGMVKAMAGDREINVRALGAVSVNVAGADAKVKINKHVLDVQKGRLVFDDKDAAQLDPNIKKVDVSVQDEMLSVKGDGKEVFRVKLDSTAK
jgi:hypothetical protein